VKIKPEVYSYKDLEGIDYCIGLAIL